MIPPKRVILDANILLRAIFGQRTNQLLAAYVATIEFYTPITCIDEALRNLPAIASKKAIDPLVSQAHLSRLLEFCVLPVEAGFYARFEEQARARMGRRDPTDWPVVATALLLNAPIWTEDQDFFGTGIPTWTSDRIEIYLRS